MTTNQPKKILFIHHGKGLGGAPLSLLYLISSLDKAKYQPMVLFLHDSDAVALFKQHNIKIFGPVNRYDFSHTKIWWFRWYHLPYLLRSLYDTIITFLWTANQWISKIQPDIIHLNTSSLIAWGTVAHNKGIPVVWHIREPLAQGYLGLRRWFITKCVAKYATKIIPICNNDAQPWANDPKTTVIYNPVDPLIFDSTISPTLFLQKYNLNPHTPTILFLGGLSKEKGTLVILEIFAKLLQKIPHAQLLIAGYWNVHASSALKKLFPAQKYKDIVQQALSKVQHATTILGPITNVPEVMAASNIIVFPAVEGHFARPIIEAGFMKKPVIASNLAPLDELVIDGKTGFLIAPNDHDLWVTKLFELLTNEALQKKTGKEAYSLCFQHFALNVYQDKIEPIYDQLAKKTKTAIAFQNKQPETATKKQNPHIF